MIGDSSVYEYTRAWHITLKAILGYKTCAGLTFGRLLTHPYLILIQFTIFVLIFAFVLKGDDDKTHEDVDHKEGDDDNVDDVKHRHDGFVVVNGTVVFLVRVYGQPQEVRPTLEMDQRQLFFQLF